MNADSRARVEALRRALELADYERSAEPVPSVWRDFLRAFPRGCCELASQALAEYLTEDGSNLPPVSSLWRGQKTPVITMPFGKTPILPRNRTKRLVKRSLMVYF